MTRTRRPRRAAAAIAVAALGILLVAPRQPSPGPSSRRAYEGYHSYAELTALPSRSPTRTRPSPAVLDRQELHGRELWAMKISDNVGTDEAEPEVLFDGGHHADEHMGVEMVIRIMRWLIDGYGSDTRITNIVNGRRSISSSR
jgi:hypothetical protein